MLLTVIGLLIMVSFQSASHVFIRGLKPSFSANPFHRSLSFSFSGLAKWIPQIFTDHTTEHDLFLLYIFYGFTLFSCRFRSVDYISWNMQRRIFKKLSLHVIGLWPGLKGKYAESWWQMRRLRRHRINRGNIFTGYEAFQAKWKWWK